MADLNDRTKANTAEGVAELEAKCLDPSPTPKERLSRYIERGSIGAAVKQARKGRCQLCEAMGQDGVAFVDKRGKPYSEAHHVVPVSLLAPNSLGAHNIMVLCANHHRQAHHGHFEVLENYSHAWKVKVDGSTYEIPKTVIVRTP